MLFHCWEKEGSDRGGDEQNGYQHVGNFLEIQSTLDNTCYTENQNNQLENKIRQSGFPSRAWSLDMVWADLVVYTQSNLVIVFII